MTLYEVTMTVRVYETLSIKATSEGEAIIRFYDHIDRKYDEATVDPTTLRIMEIKGEGE